MENRAPPCRMARKVGEQWPVLGLSRYHAGSAPFPGRIVLLRYDCFCAAARAKPSRFLPRLNWPLASGASEMLGVGPVPEEDILSRQVFL